MEVLFIVGRTASVGLLLEPFFAYLGTPETAVVPQIADMIGRPD